MSALIVLAAVAAQVAGSQGSAPSPASAGSSAASRPGATTYVDLEAGAGYSTNPFLTFGSDTGAGFGRLSVNAVHARVSERTSTALSAFGQSSFYTRRYGSRQSFNLSGRHSARVNERLTVYGNANWALDRGGQLDTRIVGPVIVPLPPGSVQPPVLVPGVDVLSVSGRQYRAIANVGGSLALSPRDSVNASAGVQHVISKNGPFETRYTAIPVSVGYGRRVSARTTVGGRISAQRTDYNGPGSIRVISPQVTLQTALSERMTFNGSIGVSFASIDNGLQTRRSTGLAGDASLCSAGERTQFCGRAAVSQSTPTAAGAARSVSIGMQYSRRLDADQRIQLSLNADRYSTPTLLTTTVSFSRATYVRGAAEYTRRFGDRWFGGLNVAGRKLTQAGPEPKADFMGALFIRYRLGDVR